MTDRHIVGYPGDEVSGVAPSDSSSQDPHDDEEVRESRRLAITWYLWPLAILLVVMLVGWLATR